MLSNTRILVVDDFEVNRKLTRQHLLKGGYQVDLAANGHQAVEAVKQQRYDLILMDLDMPLMNGYEAVNSIRRIEQDQRLHAGTTGDAVAKKMPIIAMSGNETIHADAGPPLPGMDDCICKPFRREDLLDLIKKWIACPSPTACGKEMKGDNLPQDEPGRNSDAPLDLKQALQEFMGKKEILLDVLGTFVVNGRECIQIAQNALLASDYRQIQSQAHKLGGGAANLTARKLAGAAFGVEQAVQAGEFQRVRSLLKEVERKFNEFETYLQQNAI